MESYCFALYLLDSCRYIVNGVLLNIMNKTIFGIIATRQVTIQPSSHEGVVSNYWYHTAFKNENKQ